MASTERSCTQAECIATLQQQLSAAQKEAANAREAAKEAVAAAGRAEASLKVQAEKHMK